MLRLLLLPLCPSRAGSVGARAIAYNPPTTACGALGVFESWVCLRRRAFYASPCQATTPSLERFTHCAHSAGPLRDHFQGLEIKPMFRRFLMLLQDDLGGRKWWPKEGQNRPKILLKSSQAPSKTGLEPGCRWESFWGAFWEPPGTSKIVLSL